MERGERMGKGGREKMNKIELIQPYSRQNDTDTHHQSTWATRETITTPSAFIFLPEEKTGAPVPPIVLGKSTLR